jgi:hypothetical protein
MLAAGNTVPVARFSSGRARVFAGEIFRLAGATATVALSERLRGLIRQLGAEECEDPALAAEAEVFLRRMHILRQNIRYDGAVRAALLFFLQEIGLDPQDVYCDTPRLRAIPPGSETIREARPLHFIHRDPWYANPHCQWNLWFPVFDIEANRSFALYPDYFERPIANDSARFDYQDWNRRGGFQSWGVAEDAEKIYPCAQETPDPAGARVALANAGEALLFSAAHLHGTLPNTSDRIRYSLELRIVRAADLESGAAAPVVDNQSRGTTLYEYFRLSDQKPAPASLIAAYLKKSR